MNSKKWIKILLILCLFGSGFIYGFNYLVDPQGFNNKILINNINNKKISNTSMTTRFKTNILANGKFDTIMLGTSRIGVMDPNIVNKYLNTNTFNLEYPGSNTIIQNKLFKYANNYNNIKYLIYGIDFMAFNENRIIKNDFKEFYDLEKKVDNYEKISNLDLYFNIETFTKSIKLIIKNILNIQETEPIYLSKNGMRDYKNYIEDNEKGTLQLDKEINLSIKSYFGKYESAIYKNYNFSYEYLNYFKETIDFCKKNNIKHLKLFGSFATGTATEYSDIDFVVYGCPDILKLERDMEDVETLRKIDIFDYDSIRNKQLLEDIDLYGKQIY
jgi:predicted nucleotidyltransferase